MKRITVSSRHLFSTAHFYRQSQWTKELNQSEFGLCFSEHGHGHNYFADISYEVAKSIACDPHENRLLRHETETAIQTVLRDFDHRHLNFTHPDFRSNELISTTEVIAKVFENSLRQVWGASIKANLLGVQIWETDRLAAASESALVSSSRQANSWSYSIIHMNVGFKSGPSHSLTIRIPQPLADATTKSSLKDYISMKCEQLDTLEELCFAINENFKFEVLISTKSGYFLFANGA